MIKFNLITMKDGEINIEEEKDLSKMLTEGISGNEINIKENKFCKMLGEFTKTEETDNLEVAREKHVEEVFRQRTEKVKKTKLAPGFYLNNKNSEFFTSTLETMAETITDEAKKWKIEKRISQGFIYGTFRRFKTTQPTLVKSYKTRKGAEQNTFWRNN